MSWGAIIAFLAMDGHALYVWGAYAAALALPALEILQIALRKRAILAHLGSIAVLDAAPEEPLAEAPIRQEFSDAWKEAA